MSIGLTEDTNVALYDSVTGIAFGEVFQSYEEAEHFLEFADGQDLRDPRLYGELRAAWNQLRYEQDKAAFEAMFAPCPSCGKPGNSDVAHRNGVCPDYEKFYAESYGQPALEDVPF